MSTDSAIRYNLSKKIPKFSERHSSGKIGLRGATRRHRHGLGWSMLWLPVTPETTVQELLLLPYSRRNESYEHPSV